jgi:hypothetical protein
LTADPPTPSDAGPDGEATVAAAPDPLPGEDTAERRDCAACGWSNDADRELCRRCGADVATGEELPRLVERPDPFETEAVVPTRRRRWWLPVAIVAIVAGAVVAGLWFAEVGPFATSAPVPPVAFDADRYPPDDEQVLTLTTVATRTVAAGQGDRTFAAAQLVDDDLTTAWRSDPSALEEEASELLELDLEAPAWVAAIVVANGDQFDAASFEASGRLQQVQLQFDGGERLRANLLDQRGRQLLALDEPRLTTAVRIEVLDDFPGVAEDGVAVSDVALRGWPADPDDAALARERAAVRPAAGVPAGAGG